jgi:hypothetical protein
MTSRLAACASSMRRHVHARSIELVDIRPLRGGARNISFVEADVMNPGSAPESTCDSLSRLRALEHFGLASYGDPLDPRGHERGLDSLVRMLQSTGALYLSVLVGPRCVRFNSHRRFHASKIIDLVSKLLRLVRLDLVDDHGDLHLDLPLERIDRDPPLGCALEGCGLFRFMKA